MPLSRYIGNRAGGSSRALILALLASALLHPLLLGSIAFPRLATDEDARILDVTLAHVPAAPEEKTGDRPRFSAPKTAVTPVNVPAIESDSGLPVVHKEVAVEQNHEQNRGLSSVLPPVAIAPVQPNLALRALNQARDLTVAVREAPSPRVLRWRSGQPPQAYEVERYIEEWAQKVERIGNLNYPEAARRQRLFGSLRVSVTLDAGGQVLDAYIERTSGQPVLDAAALHIIELAAPFASFGPALRAQTDQLVISRGWNFSRGDRLGSQ